jgi:hypothetical protein
MNSQNFYPLEDSLPFQHLKEAFVTFSACIINHQLPSQKFKYPPM